MGDESKVENRKLLLSAIILGFLDVLFAALVGVSAFFLATEDRSFLVYNALPQFCLPCDELLLHPDDPHDGIVFQENGTICCAANKASIPTWVDKITGRWFKEYLYKESPEYHGCNSAMEGRNNPDKEYIRVLGYENKRLTDSHRGRVHWDKDSMLSSQNMKYDHGRVHILESGVYQIYSQVVSDYNTRPPIIYGAANIFLHKIIMKKNNTHTDPKTIVSSAITECVTDEDSPQFLSHVGTVYQLYQGDTVYVEVSYPEDIVPNPRKNFFGIHMI